MFTGARVPLHLIRFFREHNALLDLTELMGDVLAGLRRRVVGFHVAYSMFLCCWSDCW